MGEVSGGRVRGMDVWCEGGLGQQRNAGRGCAKMHEREERVETLVHMKLIYFYSSIFAGPRVRSDRPPVLWWLSPGEGVMPLHDAVLVNCKNGATIKNQGAGVKYMGKGVNDE